MQAARLSDSHFSEGTGYGYGDAGREALEAVFAGIFCTEAALVRPQIVSGTHALACALFGNLRPGDMLVSPVGAPYDTLEAVIGIRPEAGSLEEFGVKYTQIELQADSTPDFPEIRRVFTDTQPKMATIQRSKGYAWRGSFTAARVEEIIAVIRAASPRTIILVDNCYGEFTESREPLGADLIAGSLIKNPGGGLATCGGYVAGGAQYVHAAACRLTAPGLGAAVGPSLGQVRQLLTGLFIAPQAVSGALKGAVLAAACFSRLGFEVLPAVNDARADIVQAVKLGTRENVLAFCRGVQRAAPVDSYVTPEDAPMPGYGDGVVMAGGTFVQGSSIELSADAPMRAPYIVYLQGGLTAAHARLGTMFAIDEMHKKGLVCLPLSV
jgi:cystathionine beta-lyase family protein involved in aluminum resistance